MKILYVEDNDDNVYMLKNRLSRAGFTVVVATDGTQGIAMATPEQPDLILMDLTLPDINGEEGLWTCSGSRRRERESSTPPRLSSGPRGSRWHALCSRQD